MCGGAGIAEGACDCAGNVLDECGVCGGAGIAEGACDCDSNVLDECGVCGGAGIAEGACDCDGNVLDECGVCGGAGIAEGACDCDGNVTDVLGVCGGGALWMKMQGICDSEQATNSGVYDGTTRVQLNQPFLNGVVANWTIMSRFVNDINSPKNKHAIWYHRAHYNDFGLAYNQDEGRLHIAYSFTGLEWYGLEEGVWYDVAVVRNGQHWEMWSMGNWLAHLPLVHSVQRQTGTKTLWHLGLVQTTGSMTTG